MPFIAFSTPTGKYIYDRGNNRIEPVTYTQYEAVVGCTEQNGDFRLPRRVISKTNYLAKVEHFATPEIQYYLDQKMENLILQVTQNCNLRCSYCEYSGLYYNRVHTNANMSIETAKKAVDFAVLHSRENETLNLGFYGGEPLLQINLIREVINYIEKEYPDKKFIYNMTVNGTLLTDDIIEFLVEKKVVLMISLDGPKPIHDMQRKFANGKGSYDIVFANLQKIKEQYPDYYKTIQTNTVVSPGNDYSCIKEFFEADDVFNILSTGLSLIDQHGIKTPIEYDEQIFILQKDEILKLFLALIGKIPFNRVSKLFKNYANELLRVYRSMRYPLRSEVAHPGGPCIPGIRKAFVDVNGKIYPCEKVIECEETQIGDVVSGFNTEKVVKVLNVGKLTETECLKCWAFSHCDICIAGCMEGRHISAEARLSRCRNTKQNVLEKLADIATLESLGADFQIMDM